MRRALVWNCLLLMSALGQYGWSADYVWIEGEAAARHTMKGHPWYDSVVKQQLSGGDWLCHFAGGPAPEAEYPFRIGVEGSYHFWVRANPVAGARISYRLDDGPWTELDAAAAQERVNIAADGKPDMRFVGWINAGQVELTSGDHLIRFRFHSDNQSHGGLDCFVFSQGPFMPRGVLKPGQRTGLADAGFFAWEPDIDEFADDALLDLRSLNEEQAGQSGRVAAQGNHFLLGSGRRVRFWGVNAGPAIVELDHDAHVYLAKTLAKRGVNLVRIHGSLYGRSDPTLNRKRLDDLQHLVAALKNEGIYVALSFYFPLWYTLDDNRAPFMLLFFDPEMQQIYYRWATALLTTPNPYTDLTLADDPAVAIVEILNEDSHFFWTFKKTNMPDRRWQRLTSLYGEWLVKKYGSLDAAVRAWGGVREAADAPSEGRMELYDAWYMTTDGLSKNAKRKRRVADQVQFLTHNMREFYEKTIDFFRSECGYEGLVSCSNWHTADPRLLDPLERYCYTAGDVIDHHGYFDHDHKGENSSWAVRPGHTFESTSALSLKENNPLPYVETEGYPHIVSEIGWPMPNAYRAEWPFLTGAVGSMQGLDGIMHFALGSPAWDQDVRKFQLNTPAVFGSFFATGLMYRRGDLAEAPAVVVDELRLEDLFALKGTNVFAGAAMDEFRASDVPAETIAAGPVKAMDPLTFYTGRVVRRLGGDPARSTQHDMTPLINREKKIIKSVTGEMIWDYGRRFVAINAERCQGVAGFVGARGAVAFGDLRVHMKNHYGTLIAVSLDDKPLPDADRILIQCMTIDRPYGWKTSKADGRGGEIQQLGTAPWGVEEIQATVALRWSGSEPRRVVACDENGYATDRPVTSRMDGSWLHLTIDPHTVYTVILR